MLVVVGGRVKPIALSAFAASYPGLFAKAIVSAMIHEKELPITVPALHVDESMPPIESESRPHPEEPSAKRARLQSVPGDEVSTPSAITETWKPVFDQLKVVLPKSGSRTWYPGQHAIVGLVQERLPHLNIRAIRVGKGLDKYIPGDMAWVDSLPIRYTVALRRLSQEILDLGEEDWSKLSKRQVTRHAIPSHILLCVFASKRESSSEPSTAPSSNSQEPAVSRPVESPPSVQAPTWSPLSATVSGPKFQKVEFEEKTIIRRLHNNLGHPTSERLSQHLRSQGVAEKLVAGARDYTCASCAESTHQPRPPRVS